ncbi:P-loop NTPase fold protein [Streptomyces sp. NPDC059866]|uniref:P-loop NTPase fold protein n=1 Tax=Streptomyces sp. NPDC059866 TaxID=3346978 RepID=UPI00364FA960
MLAEQELRDSLARSGSVNEQHLESAAEAERRRILGQAQDAQKAYEQAFARARTEGRILRLFVAVGTLVLLMLLTSAVGSGWSAALKEALTNDRSVSVKSAAGDAFGLLVFMILIAGGLAFVAWCVYWLLSRNVRAGVPAAKGRQLLVSAGLAYCSLAVVCAISVGAYPAEVAWQLRHDRPLEEVGGYGWGVWIALGTLVLFVLPVLWLRRLARSDQSGQSLPLAHRIAVFDPRERNQAEQQAMTEWREAVRQGLRSFMREKISERTERVFSTELSIDDAPGLKQLRAGHEHVETPADKQLAMISAGMENGSIALSGPRGAGKTQLLRVFCKVDEADTAGQLSLVESVPVLFDRREFMLHLFYKVCDRVIKEGLGTAQEAERHKRSIRYLQTHSDEAALSAGWRSWNLSARKATSLAQQPQMYPEILDGLKRFLSRTALELDEKNRRVVIGIDELDRIEPAATARTFLNELKAVFDVPKCLFVLSVSDEALREAELAPVGRRDAFDSAIDEIIRVEPLDQRTAEKLLGRRVVGLPVPFTALFYCLSGGMPRDLLRTARAAISYVEPEQRITLADLARKLVNRELDRIANTAGGSEESAELAQFFRADLVAEHGGLGTLGGVIHQQAGETGDRARMGATLANRAYHLDTVLRIFTRDLTEDRFTRASDPGVSGSFAALARAQREIGTADTLARSTLQRVRTAWSLPTLPPMPSA